MAHTLETRTTYDDFLKYRYKDVVIQATPEFSALLTKLQRKVAKLPFGGKSVTFGVTYNSQGSAASLAENDDLPYSMPGNYDNAVVPIYYHYFASAVSGQVMRTSEDRESAFARAWAQESLVKVRAFRQMINRQLCLDGNAILAQVDGSLASQVATIDNAGGISGMVDSDENGARFISTNMYVQARASGTVHDSGVYISAYTEGSAPSTSATITLVGTVSSWADGDYIYASSGSSTYDAYGHESPGIRLLIDDGTIAASVQSISSSTYPEWKSTVGYGSTAGTAEALTTLRMMKLVSAIQVKGGGNVDFIVTSPNVWLTYGQLADEKNMITNAKTYDNAWPTLDFMGKEIWQDPYCTDEMYFIDNRALAIYQTGDGDWITDSKGAIMTQVPGKDAMQAYWQWDMCLGIKNRKWCGKLVDITVADQI